METPSELTQGAAFEGVCALDDHFYRLHPEFTRFDHARSPFDPLKPFDDPTPRPIQPEVVMDSGISARKRRLTALAVTWAP